MRIRTMIAVLLISALLLGLTACGSSGGQPGFPSSAQPASSEAAAPAVQGADSVKTLMEKSLEYFHTGDYSAIADVHDRQAWVAWFLMEDVYREDDGLDLTRAMEKAALVFTDGETLRARDPELAELLLDEFDVEDRQEYLNEYMGEIRNAFQNGDITEDHPDYARLSQMLTDWDKGVDYMFEHYPELAEEAEAHWIVFDLDGALEMLRSDAAFDLSARNLDRFRELECEYSPEKVYVGSDGICSFDLGSVVEDNDVWEVTMLYCVRDEVYYLIGYSYVLGSLGG